MKKMVVDSREGIANLLIERDAGNEILILMGATKEDVLENWKRMKELCDYVINQLEM